MESQKQLINENKKTFERYASSQLERRHELLDRMDSLSAENITCASCTGVCCTFVKNSMQVQPIEALDVYMYIIKDKDNYDAIIEKCIDTIARFRLDVPPPSDGKRSFSRRRYTCPFFGDKSLGCSLPPSVKPYGCLAFNAKSPNVAEGENCQSDQTLLEAQDKRINTFSTEANKYLKESIGLDWDKVSLPQALVELHLKNQ